ncbi:MAG: conjugal transfer protein TraF [Nitrospirae bacterium]|nr:conjugal transfer protein TraF [Candidatus Manganitrophaceae bacterium]
MIHLRKQTFFIWMTVVMMTFLIASRVSAGEWQIIGPRALGMGGAGVAVANDSTASYWNPGAFGFFDGPDDDYYGKRKWSSTVAGAGIGAKLHNNFGDTIRQVTDIDFNGIDDNNISADKVSDFIGLLDGLEGFRGQESKIATVSGNGRFGIQSGHFGFAGNVFLDVTAIPNFDFENLGPDNTAGFTIADFTDPNNLGCPTCSTANTNGVTVLTTSQVSSIDSQLPTTWTQAQRNGYINALDNGLSQAGQTIPSDIVDQAVGAATLANAAVGGGALSQNTSSLRFVGIALFEVPLTYGRAFSENLSIGGNLKYMKARIYDVDIDILNQDFGDALDDALDKYQEDSNFGIDLGALYRVGETFRVGLVGRNLNAPKFGNLKEEAQVRTGIAYQPNRMFTLAADLDLTKNDISVGSRLKSQNVGVGLELDLIFLQLRGGAYKNMAENDIGLVYTAGLGVNLWLVNLDIGASMSKDSTNLDGDKIPEEARAEFALSMLF